MARTQTTEEQGTELEAEEAPETGTESASEEQAREPEQEPEQAQDPDPNTDEAPTEDPKPARRRRLGKGSQLTDEAIRRAIAAMLFASPEPLSEGRLVDLLENPEPARVREALEILGEELEQGTMPLCLRKLAGGWRILTSEDQAEHVTHLAGSRKIEKISPAALETLAIVAYRQPVTKAEIESIRGVQAGAILRSLVDRGLAKVTGRADQPGAPLQYGTTKEFLDRFGLGSLQDLPRDAELSRD